MLPIIWGLCVLMAGVIISIEVIGYMRKQNEQEEG